jgi:membrane protein DedA with SNARE-associated domain
MISQILATLVAAIIAVISQTGYIGVAVLMALESACIPLPSEVILPFAGYLASTGRFSLAGVATAGALGCNIGSTAAYLAAAQGGRPLVERWGSFLLISQDELRSVEIFFARWGAITIFIGRLLPVIRTFIAVPAGLARMPQGKFQIYTFVGSWLWCYTISG